MMTSTIRKFGVGVASVALVASAAVPAFAANDRQSQEVPGPLDGMVKLGRIGGFDRIETAIKIAEKAFADMGNDVEVAYIAGSSDASAVDSAAAGHLSDGPLYLVAGDNRSLEAVAKSITDHYPNVQKIVAIGGTAVVSDAALKAVADKALVTATARVAGKDRYETAAAIAEYGSTNKGTSEGNQFFSNDFARDRNGVPQGSKVYLARGDNPVDALVSGVLKDAPVLLLGPDGTVPEATAAYLKKHLPTQFVALGGDKAVPTSSFLKADFDPVMKNIWTNNEEVQAAEAALAKAGKLLDGIPGAKGVNPKNLDPNVVRLTQTQIDAIDRVIRNLQNSIGDENSGLTQALQNAIDTAVSTQKDALDEAKYHYLGKGFDGKDSGGETATRDDTPGTYVGSKAAANFNGTKGVEPTGKETGANGGFVADTAAAKLWAAKKNTNTVEDFKKAINDLIAAYEKLSSPGVTEATKFGTDLNKYITKYWETSEKTTTTELVSDANVKKFIDVWNAKKNSLSAGMIGNTDASASEVFVAGADASGVKTALTALETPATSLAAAEADFADAVELAKSDKAELDKAQKAYDDAVEKAKKDNSGVLQAQAALEAAQEQLNAMRTKKAGKGEPFMGYRNIEKRYSSINGVYNNGVRRLRAAIDSELSEAINSESASPEQLYRFNQLPELVYKAYGITLTEGNVREYFSFKKSSISGQLQVVRANHARMAEGRYGTYEELSTNDMVAQATSMIDTFYNKMSQGFEVGDMESYFADGGLYTENMYDGVEYKKLTDKKKKMVNAAAKAVIDALITGASKTDTYWKNATKITLDSSSFTITPYGYIGAARVSDYLDGIAKRNRKTAEENLAKAQVAYQAAIDKISPKRYFRIDGTDRYNTSAAIAGYWRAKYLGLDNEKKAKKADVYIANGISYIDAVAGGQLKGGPIVLVAPDGTMTDAVKQRFAFAASDNPVVNVYALGGTKAVPEQALTTAKSAALDKSLLGKNFFSEATNKAVDNADKKADEKK